MFKKISGVLTLALIFAFIYGWVANITSIIAFTMPITGMIIARVIGVFLSPLGAILGYF